ncbi:MAG: radical SAM protein [Candidatus Omnitrophica bacterium]|nr:radical SAM protein [Candidatus Omnitrophota bacterium]MBU4468512.1 radical SAM protein [Candidatus Omnitrophota bacterium]MCG2707974.1 radical SAM protein [Candidatus Omnitrophota bacterium]
MQYIYGPIKSRRLGLSLGLSLSRDKICDLDCIYCQWGSVGKTVLERKEYAKADEIIRELKSWMQNNPRDAQELKFVTLSGLGEPTLNTCIGELIDQVKNITGSKIAVITNSTLLGDPTVRQGLLKADLIVPSLDAVDLKIFKQIDRPHAGIKLNEIIDGLVALRKEFHGQIWLEVMLIAGMNDGLGHIAELKKAILRINPDKIQLNSPVRSTAEQNVFPVEKGKLEQIREILGDKAEII